jgi:hypothetical protein
MRPLRAALLALAALALATRPAFAWDELGHRVVARIAWDQMTPAARTAAVRLLMNAPANPGLREMLPLATPEAERGRELFVLAAVWPDVIRSRTHMGNGYAHGDWHYVNFFWEQQVPGGPVHELPDHPLDGQLLNQLPGLQATLADPAASDSARSVALAWVLHLVGDVHQPLHNSARITPQDPQGDRGGNLFLLGGLYPRNNLHAYWDSLVGFAEPWRVGEVSEADYVGSVAARLERRFPPRLSRSRLFPGEYRRWSLEGVTLAQRSLYPAWLVRGERAPQRYQPLAWAGAQTRLTMAGYRLGALVNAALGG